MNIKVNDVELFYDRIGIGPTLILLHGNGEDHHIFDKIVNKLKENFTIYSIDSRGHGESEKVDSFSYEIMTQDIYQFILELDLKNPSILGFSDGAIMALLLAMEYGNLLDKLVLLGVNLKPSDFTEESYDFIKSHYEKTKSPLFKLMLEEPNIELDDIKKVTNPTFLIASENDIFKEETYIKIQNTLPNSQLKIIKDHDHDSYINNNDMLYPLLLEFFCKKF